MKKYLLIYRIDKETDDALQNVEKGRKILTQTYRDISSNRGLIIKVNLKFYCLLIIIFCLGSYNLVYIFHNLYYIFAINAE